MEPLIDIQWGHGNRFRVDTSTDLGMLLLLGFFFLLLAAFPKGPR